MWDTIRLLSYLCNLKIILIIENNSDPFYSFNKYKFGIL